MYNYIIVIIKYDVDHCGSNPFFVCWAYFGMVIEIRDKVEKKENNWVRAYLLGSAGTKWGGGRQNLRNQRHLSWSGLFGISD